MLNTTQPFDCFGISDLGLVREHNEDVWAAFPELGLFLLADGMGGHSAGEVAAKVAVDHLAGLVKKWRPPKDINLEDAQLFFQKALIETNSLIYQQGQESEELAGMGTTLCVLYFLSNNKIILGHVGDSRIYRLRMARLTQLTEDHSLVSEMVALGVMDPAEGKAFPYKHILTRAIGSHPTVEPAVAVIDYQPKDLFLLCSDGLTNFVQDDEIKQVLLQDISLKKKGGELVNLANQHGGGDNVTCILVRPSLS